MTLEGTSYFYWDSQIPLDALRKGPLVMSGADYALPGPNGLIYVITAGLGSIRLDTTYEQDSESE